MIQKLKRAWIRRRAAWWNIQVVSNGKWTQHLCRARSEKSAVSKVRKRHNFPEHNQTHIWAVQRLDWNRERAKLALEFRREKDARKAAS